MMGGIELTIEETRETIIKRFLLDNDAYLGLALAVEGAVESIRNDRSRTVELDLSADIETLAQAIEGKWSSTKDKRGNVPFWHRLYRSAAPKKPKALTWDDNEYSGIWVCRNTSAREPLELEIGVAGWPKEGSSNTERKVQATFDDFIGRNDPSVWSEVSWTESASIATKTTSQVEYVSRYFDGDRAFLTDDPKSSVKRVVGLVRQLMMCLDEV